MTKSKKLENQSKSKGAVIFAYNNESIDYVRLAEINAKLLKKYLGLDTTLITDAPTDSDVFDNVIIVENNATNKRTFRWDNGTEEVNWRNIGRYDVYDLSPYDRTLLLDADYFVSSDSLNNILQSNTDLSAFTDAFDVTGANTFHVDQYLNFNSLDMYWATVIVFNKTDYTKNVFSLMKHIKENWAYYKDLYNFNHSMYRNDYSFTIAVNTINGFVNSFEKIPWSLPTLGTEETIKKITDDNYYVISKNGFKGTTPINDIILWSGDLHIMNKKSLDTTILEHLL